ncbi:MAG TPA: hypothetical protein VK254_02615 [Candidatus Bathyarchaeia archaeon]|nr:hypothetical protein [Candidatus Bathyarchaeia archaeon]
MKTKRASGLIMSVILLFVILAMVVTLSSITALETKMGQKSKSSVGAFYNSESGVEWALNLIASKNSSVDTIASTFGPTGWDTVSATSNCPASFGTDTCKVLFLDQNGNVIYTDVTLDQIKAIRSVGNKGGETARAIEAAVAAGGGGCYISYKAGCSGASCCLAGFTNKGSLGSWGYCGPNLGGSGVGSYFRPPGGGCFTALFYSGDSGEAFLCCQ